jgi:hypothetical protein
VDLATNAGLAQGVPGERPVLSSKRFGKPGDSDDKVLAECGRWVADLLGDDETKFPMAVYVEAPMGIGARSGDDGKAARTSSRALTRCTALWGAVAGVCGVAEIPCERVAVSTVRAFFIFQGHAKTDVAERETMRMCRVLGWTPQNHDEADAAAGFHWASSLFVPEIAQFWSRRA